MTALQDDVDRSSGAWAWQATRAFVLVCAIGVVGCVAGSGVVVYYVVPLVSVLLAVRFLRRSDSASFVFFVAWWWVAGPGVRRFVEFYAGFEAQSLVLATPAALSVLGLVAILRATTRVDGLLLKTMALTGLLTLYGALVGSIFQDVPSVVASGAQWIPPLVFGLYVATLPPPELKIVRERLPRFAVVALFVLSTYALVQLVVVPVWDQAWLNSVSSIVSSFGEPEPFRIRVFSLSNSPGPYAVMAAWLVIVTLSGRCGPGAILTLALAAAGIAMSEVRTAWLLLAVALIMLVARGTVRLVPLAAFLVSFGVAFWLFGGPLRDSFVERLETAQNAANDTSLLARVDFQLAILPDLVTNPFGFGLGATGAGVRASGDAAYDQLGSTDSGFLDIWISFGALLGTVLIAMVLVLCIRHWRFASPEQGALTVHLSAFVTLLPLLLLLGVTLNAVGGFLAWTSLALLDHRSVAATRPRSPERVAMSVVT